MAQMANAVVTSIYAFYDGTIANIDTRVEDLPLMSSPFPTALLCLTFILGVKVLGPALMKDREPFQLKNTLVVYNFSQVLVSAFLFYELGMGGWWNGYSYLCQPLNRSMDPVPLRMVRAIYFYYLSKYYELVDTMLFVLRKKQNCLTLAHVSHHGVMPLSAWFLVKFIPGGHASFFCFINSLAHVGLYVYYLATALGLDPRRSFYWKKHLTESQLVELTLIMVHSLQLVIRECGCSFYHKLAAAVIGTHAFFFLVLFSDLYYRVYIKGPRCVQVSSDAEADHKLQFSVPPHQALITSVQEMKTESDEGSIDVDGDSGHYSGYTPDTLSDNSSDSEASTNIICTSKVENSSNILKTARKRLSMQ